LLRGLQRRARLTATLVVIGFFALVTRFEPSVLRASAMAALAVTAATMGREASSLRLLALAVGGLVLVDPFLVRSVGFQLSVAACIGIVVLSPAIARSLPGPRFVVEALAVTLGAQVGVAPLLVTTFGGVPVAAVPANLLAAPAEAPVMVSGLVGGVAAGLVGSGAAGALLWPTHLLIAWIAWVAHVAAAAPLGELHGPDLALVVVALVGAAAARHVGWRGVAYAAVAATLVGLAAPAVRLQVAAPTRVQLTGGAVLWRAGGSVLDLDGRVDAERLLEALRRAGVTQVDVVVARTSSPAIEEAVDAVRRRATVERTLSPATVTVATTIEVGRLVVDVRPVTGRLAVDVAVDGVAARSARGPPV
jgi:competence protein ComEC